MPITLRVLYDVVHELSTETQSKLCLDLTTAFARKKARTLASWFCEDLKNLKSYSNLEQPFLHDDSGRKPPSADSTGTRKVIHLLIERSIVPVVDSSNKEVLRFKYENREIAPLRKANAGLPYSGAGGIDYLAHRMSGETRVPIIGEIKVQSDQNAFYAFLQLLTYFSELGTPNQIARANMYQPLFGGDIGQAPRFELHILLADFNDRGEKGPLIPATRKLATAFKTALATRAEGRLLGGIVCLKMDIDQFESSPEEPLYLQWSV